MLSSWRRPTIQFYKPNADKVSLKVEGYEHSWPMKKDRHGNWKVKLRKSREELVGREYYFEVRRNGDSWKIADPLAHRTERLEHNLVSIFSDLSYLWQHKHFKAPPITDIVIYETHLPALTRHESAEVQEEKHRGTYIGARSPAILSHLQRLNVVVEFLPLHASDKLLGQDWGYFSTSFKAMRECYAVNKIHVNREVMSVIDAMHGKGIPVILDVVFNHGGELWVKAWGEDVVYRKHDNGDFCHGSGCGPTIRTEHSLIRETIIQTLEHLVKNYRFDGFRFDLGALHDKQTMLEIDRRLPPPIYLIAEPWALGGACWGKGDLHGDLATTRWAVWNDDFREPGKTFLTGAGDHHNRDRLMCAIKGTHVNDGGWAKRPQQCINYLSSHDGKTLADFVGGEKHRVFLGVMLVLVSQGVPMLGEGTELMFSKQGHDNSYNRPDLNQIDWRNALAHEDLVKAVAGMIALRNRFPHFHYTDQLRQRHEHRKKWDIDWIYPTGHPHNDNVNAIGFVLKSPPNKFIWRKRLVILLNGSHDGVDFHIPKGKWKVLVDGHDLVVNINGVRGVPNAVGDYHVHSGTGVILAQA